MHSAAERLRAYIEKNGLKASRQRDIIADVFLNSQGHLRVDELLAKARSIDPKISQATIYRAMKLLTDSGIAEARNFQDGTTRYEIAGEAHEHHDHLICTQCDTIVEFFDERIEALQEVVAKSHGFKVSSHRMELYGLCKKCGK